MKLSAVKKRAKEAGVDEAKLEEADDADDVQAAVIELIVEKNASCAIVEQVSKTSKEHQPMDIPPMTDEEKKAITKLQARVRGTQTRTELEQTDPNLVKKSKMAIMMSQAAVTFFSMLGSFVLVLGPMYLFGELYGALEQGEGFYQLMPNVGLRVAAFGGFNVWCMEATYAEAVDVLPDHVPSQGWRAARVVLTFVMISVWHSTWYPFKDLDDPDADLSVIPGLVGGIISECCHTFILVLVLCPEWYRIFRMRDIKLPPHKTSTWYEMAQTKAGRPTYYAAIIAMTGYAVWEAVGAILVAFLSYSDKAGTIEFWCNGSMCYFNGIANNFYFPALLITLVVSIAWSRAKWPPKQRDLPAAILLAHFQYIMCYMGSFMATTLYTRFGDAAGGSTLVVQIGKYPGKPLRLS